MVILGSWHGSVEWCGGVATSASLAPRPPPATQQSTEPAAPHSLHPPFNPPRNPPPPDTGLHTGVEIFSLIMHALYHIGFGYFTIKYFDY